MIDLMKPDNYLDVKTGKPAISITNKWLMSEKYDGQRAYWNKDQLLSINGNVILTPDWLKKTLNISKYPLDGELYFGRRKFHMTGIFRSSKCDEIAWKGVKYMIFDIPDKNMLKHFPERQSLLKKEIEKMKTEWAEDFPFPISIVDYVPIKSLTNMNKVFKDIVDDNGEGLILRNPFSYYKPGKSTSILKYKPILDTEAIIIEHIPGKGKFEGLLGSFKVKDYINNKIVYGVSGLNMTIRRNYKRTHPIGTIITVLYTETYPSGKPRFPRYKGIRHDKEVKKEKEEKKVKEVKEVKKEEEMKEVPKFKIDITKYKINHKMKSSELIVQKKDIVTQSPSQITKSIDLSHSISPCPKKPDRPKRKKLIL